MSAFSIRPFDYAADVPRLVEILNCEELIPLTEDSVRRDEASRRAEGVLNQQQTAVNGDNVPIGFSYVGRGRWTANDKLRVNIVVDSAWRRRGVGACLLENAKDWAKGQGANILMASVRDDDPYSLRFAEKHGFVKDRHRFVSYLDVATFDEARFAGVLMQKEVEGLTFTSLAELGDTEYYRRKLYEINMLANRDEPAFDGTIPSFEEFNRMVFAAWWFRADGQFLAFDDDQAVGIAAVGHNPANNIMFHAFTGTHPDYRGRGIALALKLRTIRFARELGVSLIETHNDSKNPAMLSINDKLGYVRQPGQFQLKRSLSW